MKKTNIITLLSVTATAVLILVGCDNKRQPGKIYMPDMTYSRAVETYALLDSNLFTSDPSKAGHEIFYNAKPVTGTMRKGDIAAYTLPNDSAGYLLSASIKNPLAPLTKADSSEAARLFNVNCAICHGAGGTGNGPVAGKIGAVANLTLDAYVAMADGTMYHSIYYGKNNMGSYASQLDRKQRWMMVQYIRSLQPKKAAGAASTDSTAKATTAAAPKADSTKTK